MGRRMFDNDEGVASKLDQADTHHRTTATAVKLRRTWRRYEVCKYVNAEEQQHELQ